MTWHVTYRLPAIEGGAEITATLDSDWCDARGIDPGTLDSAEQAAWAVALLLGTNSQDDATLITIEDDPGS